ncbi:hypothetical protein B7463_g4179, partial [Scytalidium lignicola]
MALETVATEILLLIFNPYELSFWPFNSVTRRNLINWQLVCRRWNKVLSERIIVNVNSKILGELVQYATKDVVLRELKKLGESKFDPNSIFVTAAIRGYEDVVQLLIDKGADVDAEGVVSRGRWRLRWRWRWSGPSTAIRVASLYGHVQLVKQLLNAGADVDKRGWDGASPLHCAVCNGHTSVVRLLLEHGADMTTNGLRRNIGTPLYDAASRGYLGIVKLLLDRGADIEIGVDQHETPLQVAIRNGHKSMVKALVDKGANVKVKYWGRDTTLHLAIKCKKKVKGIVQLLLKKGVDANERDDRGWTALHWATSLGWKGVVRLLIRKENVEKNCQASWDRRTPLHLAAAESNPTLVKLLVESGADVDICDRMGWTALHAATDKCCKQTVRILLRNSAKINAKGAHGETALHIAAYHGHTALVLLLLDYGADIEAGMEADIEAGMEERAFKELGFKLRKNAIRRGVKKQVKWTALDIANAKRYMGATQLLREKAGYVYPEILSNRQHSSTSPETGIMDEHLEGLERLFI